MARKKQIDSDKIKIDDESLRFGLKPETLRTVYAILLFMMAILLALAPMGNSGVVGTKLYEFFRMLLGVGYFLVPVLSLMVSVSLFTVSERKPGITTSIGAGLFFVAGLGLISLTNFDGGIVGRSIASGLVTLFGYYASVIALIGLLAISFIVIFDTHLSLKNLSFFTNPFKKRGEDSTTITDAASLLSNNEVEASYETVQEGISSEEYAPVYNRGTDMVKAAGADEFRLSFVSAKEFVPPPLTLLERDKGKPGVGDIKAQANIIKRTLQNFGISVEMDEISIGPSITRYALKPAEGIKLSRIVALQNDLSLALAAHPIRIEAPIPGKSLVGIEIPNTTKATVGLASLFSSEEYQNSQKPLLVALGKGISGKSFFANLAKMPHCLIAGATGSGKSATIHALITSLLFRNPPENLRFIMIDPKRVELTLYNKIPHLLTPVITDPKKAILALKWTAKEMERRYTILEKEQVRDVESYHKNILGPALTKVKSDPEEVAKLEQMPYIVVILDELADIMQTYPRELEAGIVRLAQMSRAVGIHLILSTQRPSVNVITGLIKANIPARIALQVASQIDSRTILDMPGAEKLLGAGDMLYLSGDMSQPSRIQSGFISEFEVKRVVKYLVEAYADAIPNEIQLGETHQAGPNSIFSASLEDEGGSDDDDLYEEARAAVIQAGKASTSYLQRKLKIGYSRAARLMDILEERDVIGPADGSKPREVINSNPQSSAEELREV